MSTNAQITANQQNARLSTGPTSEAGIKRSSQNACKHGFTGQSLIVTPQEKEAYEAHVQAYMAAHKAIDHKHIQLVQQLADADWSLHQIFIQQSNTMSLMTAITMQLSEAGDPIATAAAIAPVARTLNTLSTYEVRRRRAAKSIQEELAALEQQISEQPTQSPNSNKANDNREIGSVCSSPVHIVTQSDYDKWSKESDALLAQLEAEVGPEEAAKIRREAAKLSR